MEDIYPPKNYKASINFPLKKYFKEFKDLFSSPITEILREDEKCDRKKYLSALKNLMGVDVSMNDLKELAETCSPQNLTCNKENTTDFPLPIPEMPHSRFKIPSGYMTSTTVNLETVKRKLELEKIKTPFHLTLGNKRNYHTILKFPEPALRDLGPGDDFIVTILVYRPFVFQYFGCRNKADRLRFNHEISVLGRTTLDQLRDAIICGSDAGLCREVQTTTEDLSQLANASKTYPSGFIFIDGTFYNDFRQPDAIDYSHPIIEWAKDKKIGEFKSLMMENVPINSLEPRFGYPYLYMHQGNCEHLLVFSDARMLQEGDCFQSKCYPHVSKVSQGSNRLCFMCGISFATWIVINSNRLPQDKVFMCTGCCKSYNYMGDTKIGDFKLYPFFQKHFSQ